METFDFYLDTKVTTWYRTKFEIEGENEEDAKKKSIEFLNNNEVDLIPWEQIDDTIEVMSIKENDNQPTKELFDENDNVIWDNTKTN